MLGNQTGTGLLGAYWEARGAHNLNAAPGMAEGDAARDQPVSYDLSIAFV